MRLEGKVAIITGGGSGLGREACLLFAREGAKVVVADCNLDKAEVVAQEIGESKACAIQVNVADSDSVKEMVQLIMEQFGQIDILVNNAGITGDNFLTKLDEVVFDRVMSINLKGVFNCAQAVAPHMIERKVGRIINTSSVVGVYGNVGQTPYAAAKAGVIAMTKTWAKELGKYGINVNAVAPGFIETPMTEAVPNKVLDLMREKTPLKRLGQPIDIANAYLYLASDESSYVNGAVLGVDGGLVL